MLHTRKGNCSSLQPVYCFLFFFWCVRTSSNVSATKCTLTFPWRNYAICLKSGVWFCELCNWEIGTIIPDLIPNTLRPQHRFLPLIAVLLCDWPAEGGRCTMRAFGPRWLVSLTPLQLLPGDLLPACQTHDPVAEAACCNENISVGGWIYRLVLHPLAPNGDRVSSLSHCSKDGVHHSANVAPVKRGVREAWGLFERICALVTLCFVNRPQHWRCVFNFGWPEFRPGSARREPPASLRQVSPTVTVRSTCWI